MRTSWTRERERERERVSGGVVRGRERTSGARPVPAGTLVLHNHYIVFYIYTGQHNVDTAVILNCDRGRTKSKKKQLEK